MVTMIYDEGDDDTPRSWRMTSGGTPATPAETEEGSASNMTRAQARAAAQALEDRTGRHVFLEPAGTQVVDAPGTHRR